MPLFGKKSCFVCGKQTGLFDSIKMCGGTICNTCSAKIPSYLKDKLIYQNQVIDYLKYKEKNLSEFSTFAASRVFGESDKIFIDEQNQKFYIKYLFSGCSDLIDFSSIIDCTIKVDERKEITQSDNTIDKLVSIIKPSYTFTFNFYFNISLNHPWVNQLIIKLNQNPIQVKVTSSRGADPISPRLQNPDCIYFEKMGEEIKNSFIIKNSEKKAETVGKCPHCGAPIKGVKETTGQCGYCGGFCSF